LLDGSGNGHDFIQATSTKMPIVEGLGWNSLQPSLLFDGTDDLMTNTSLPQALAGGTDTAFTRWIVFQMVTAAVKAVWNMGSTVTSAARIVELLYNTTGPVWSFDKLDDAALTKTTNYSPADLNRHKFEQVMNGTVLSVNDNGVDVSLTAAGDWDVGVTTLNQEALGARKGAAESAFGNVRIAAVIDRFGVATAAEKTAMRTYITSVYG
jgi:hypothetical protein